MALYLQPPNGIVVKSACYWQNTECCALFKRGLCPPVDHHRLKNDDDELPSHKNLYLSDPATSGLQKQKYCKNIQKDLSSDNVTSKSRCFEKILFFLIFFSLQYKKHRIPFIINDLLNNRKLCIVRCRCPELSELRRTRIHSDEELGPFV